MNDERLERELRAALLQDEPAPMREELGRRVASVPDEMSTRRGLVRFPRAPRLLASLRAVAAVVVVGAILVAALGLRGANVAPAASARSSATPTGPAPSTSPAVTPTPSATPISSPITGTWRGLRWSAPSVISDSTGLASIVAWNGELLAVGDVQGSGSQTQVGFWRSTDGTAWTRLSIDDATFANGEALGLVTTPSSLVAWGWVGEPTCTGQGEGMTCGPMPVMLWTSPDGASWTRVPDISMFKGATIGNIVYGSQGLVAVGDTGWDKPAIWVSTTGATWQRQSLPSATFKDAHFSAATATASGYVLAGATGGNPPVSGGVELPSTGVAAAWWSPDGRTWTKATVQRTDGMGTNLGGIAVGANGMVAVGSATGGKGAASAWTSTDGRTWQPIAIGGDYAGMPTPVPGAPALPAFTITGDGAHLVALGDDQAGLHIWTSSDGVTWQELPFSGVTGTISPAINDVGVVPGGLIAIATSSTTQQVSVWRVTALP